MLSIRKLVGSAFVAGAAAAIAIAPTAVMVMDAPAATTNQIVAEPHGAGGPDGNGGGSGCGHDSGWQGCGGFVPGQGGFGHGCINGLCGNWDQGRGWFSG